MYNHRLCDFLLSHYSQSYSNKTNKKSSKDLYREAAAQMLAASFSCEFTENCRCLDCQVK